MEIGKCLSLEGNPNLKLEQMTLESVPLVFFCCLDCFLFQQEDAFSEPSFLIRVEIIYFSVFAQHILDVQWE